MTQNQEKPDQEDQETAAPADFLVFTLAQTRFAFGVDTVHDIVRHIRTTAVPLAPHDITGVFNLRGSIVTLHDLGTMLDLHATSCAMRPVTVVLSHRGELHGFSVDTVDGVVPAEALTSLPGRAAWHRFADGFVLHDDDPVAVLNSSALFERIS